MTCVSLILSVYVYVKTCGSNNVRSAGMLYSSMLDRLKWNNASCNKFVSIYSNLVSCNNGQCQVILMKCTRCWINWLASSTVKKPPSFGVLNSLLVALPTMTTYLVSALQGGEKLIVHFHKQSSATITVGVQQTTIGPFSPLSHAWPTWVARWIRSILLWWIG